MEQLFIERKKNTNTVIVRLKMKRGWFEWFCVRACTIYLSSGTRAKQRAAWDWDQQREQPARTSGGHISRRSSWLWWCWFGWGGRNGCPARKSVHISEQCKAVRRISWGSRFLKDWEKNGMSFGGFGKLIPDDRRDGQQKITKCIPKHIWIASRKTIMGTNYVNRNSIFRFPRSTQWRAHRNWYRFWHHSTTKLFFIVKVDTSTAWCILSPFEFSLGK